MDTNTIATAIKTEIESGALPAGTVLKQELLAERFGVSRQPVRQALDRLFAAGLVTRRPDRSLAVTGLSAEEARELAEIRLCLESAALTQAFGAMTESDLRKCRRLNEDLIEEDDPASLEELDIEFHRVLYARCGNARLLSMIEGLRRESRRAYVRQPKGSDERVILHAEHTAIVDACVARDFPAAAAALTKHLQQTTARLTQDEGEVR